MLELSQINKIIKNKNVMFAKNNCPFCNASKSLFDKLVDLNCIDHYEILTLNRDIDDQTLTHLVATYGWQPDSNQHTCSKPQIFIQGEYIGGNFEFYNSKWNTGKDFPNIKNPMRF